MKNKQNLAQLIQQVLDEWEIQLQLIELRAKAKKAMYDNLILEGFSEEQALEIVKVSKEF